MRDIENLRIHFYGVQGSGSTFPSFGERRAVYQRMAYDLVSQIVEDLSRTVGPNGHLSGSLESLIGGPINRKTLIAYRDKFEVPEARIYGGWTTCFHLETADGYDIVLDCGSGFRICAKEIVNKWNAGLQGELGDRSERKLFIFGSHSHYDHTEGFDQAAVCFDPRNQIYIYGNRQYLKALDQNLGIFSRHVDCNLKGVQTPLNYELMPAKFHSCEIRDFEVHPPSAEPDALAERYHDVSKSIQLGNTTIQPFQLFHPSPCLGYRFEHGGKVFVYCTDHELRRGDNPNDPLQMASLEAEARLREQAMGADVLYRDGQFLQAEYDGLKGIDSSHGVSRLDWGHSCIEDVIKMAQECQVKQTYIGHHDPNRTWQDRNWMDETLKRTSDQTGLGFELARAETVVDL